ncbi:MAG: alpha/beta fold hydrolase [Nocardioides sp.]
MTTSLLFISGAGLPAWVWDQVRDRLAPTSAVAPRPGTDQATVTDYAQAALEAAPAEDFILVVHSAGGIVASEVARLAPDRVAGLLAVSAVVPGPDDSFVSCLPFPKRLILPLVLRLAGTRPPESAIRKSLADGLDESTTARLIADLDPEPRSFFTTCTTSGLAATSMPTGYVVTTDDRELPTGLQRRYADRLTPSFRTRIPCGHLPMLAAPDALAAAITQFTCATSSTQ